MTNVFLKSLTTSLVVLSSFCFAQHSWAQEIDVDSSSSPAASSSEFSPEDEQAIVKGLELNPQLKTVLISMRRSLLESANDAITSPMKSGQNPRNERDAMAAQLIAGLSTLSQHQSVTNTKDLHRVRMYRNLVTKLMHAHTRFLQSLVAAGEQGATQESYEQQMKAVADGITDIALTAQNLKLDWVDKAQMGEDPTGIYTFAMELNTVQTRMMTALKITVPVAADSKRVQRDGFFKAIWGALSGSTSKRTEGLFRNNRNQVLAAYTQATLDIIKTGSRVDHLASVYEKSFLAYRSLARQLMYEQSENDYAAHVRTLGDAMSADGELITSINEMIGEINEQHSETKHEADAAKVGREVQKRKL
jgi:hypothetical protein